MNKTKRIACRMGATALVTVTALALAVVLFFGAAVAGDVQEDQARLQAAEEARAKADTEIAAAKAQLQADQQNGSTASQPSTDNTTSTTSQPGTDDTPPASGGILGIPMPEIGPPPTK